MDERLQRILDVLADFDLYQYSRRYSPECGEDTLRLKQLLEKHSINAIVCCGMTKVCIVSPELDYVIKMDRKEYHDCAREAQIYQLAIKHRIERIFLETSFVGKNNFGLSFYIQPKINTSFNDLSDKDKAKLANKTAKVTENVTDKVWAGLYCNIHELWLKAAILAYGKKFMKVFETFTHTCFINDLHTANIGFRNGKPVLLDYSGFHGSNPGSFYNIKEEM